LKRGEAKEGEEGELREDAARPPELRMPRFVDLAVAALHATAPLAVAALHTTAPPDPCTEGRRPRARR